MPIVTPETPDVDTNKQHGPWEEGRHVAKPGESIEFETTLGLTYVGYATTLPSVNHVERHRGLRGTTVYVGESEKADVFFSPSQILKWRNTIARFPKDRLVATVDSQSEYYGGVAIQIFINYFRLRQIEKRKEDDLVIGYADIYPVAHYTGVDDRPRWETSINSKGYPSVQLYEEDGKAGVTIRFNGKDLKFYSFKEIGQAVEDICDALFQTN